MKIPIFNPVFMISVACYIALLVCKKAEIYLGLISDYGADFLAMPVVLGIALTVIRLMRKEWREYRFLIGHVLAGVILYFILFEFVYPRLTPRFTADLLDGIAYLLGGVLFYFTINQDWGIDT